MSDRRGKVLTMHSLLNLSNPHALRAVEAMTRCASYECGDLFSYLQSLAESSARVLLRGYQSTTQSTGRRNSRPTKDRIVYVRDVVTNAKHNSLSLLVRDDLVGVGANLRAADSYSTIRVVGPAGKFTNSFSSFTVLDNDESLATVFRSPTSSERATHARDGLVGLAKLAEQRVLRELSDMEKPQTASAVHRGSGNKKETTPEKFTTLVATLDHAADFYGQPPCATSYETLRSQLRWFRSFARWGMVCAATHDPLIHAMGLDGLKIRKGSGTRKVVVRTPQNRKTFKATTQ